MKVCHVHQFANTPFFPSGFTQNFYMIYKEHGGSYQLIFHAQIYCKVVIMLHVYTVQFYK